MGHFGLSVLVVAMVALLAGCGGQDTVPPEEEEASLAKFRAGLAAFIAREEAESASNTDSALTLES